MSQFLKDREGTEKNKQTIVRRPCSNFLLPDRSPASRLPLCLESRLQETSRRAVPKPQHQCLPPGTDSPLNKGHGCVSGQRACKCPAGQLSVLGAAGGRFLQPEAGVPPLVAWVPPFT